MITKYNEVVDEKYFITDFNPKLKAFVHHFTEDKLKIEDIPQNELLFDFLKQVGKPSSLSWQESAILLGIYSLNSMFKESIGEKIFSFFNLDKPDILEFSLMLKELISNDFIESNQGRLIRRLTERTVFNLSDAVYDQFIKESQILPINYECEEFKDFLFRFEEYLNKTYSSNLSHLGNLLYTNLHLEELKWLEKYNLNDLDKFYFLTYLILNKDHLCDFSTDSLYAYFDVDANLKYNQDLKNCNNRLVSNGLIEPVFRSSLNTTGQFKLTDKVVQYYSKRNVLTKTYRPSSLLQYKSFNDVKHKPLVFNTDLNVLEEEILDLLRHSSFNNYQKMCAQQGISRGLSVFLFGAPGTGKTEWVMQMAKKTKRDIFHVNISEIRDKFVGQSEQNIMEIFKAYNDINKLQKNKGILLFNEADALIGNRIQVDSSVDQMNNSMQNILLEQLEDFDGIFVATTNLPQNIDGAFSRRFLYKIKVEIPDVSSRQKLLALYFPNYSTAVHQKWANQFEFTGAMLQNISKKIFIKSCLKQSVTLETVEGLLKQEFISLKNHTPIKGFSN